MRRWLLRMALVVAALGGVGTAHADYDDGQRAWDAGRHSEALRQWQAAANAGDAKAMLALGRLYGQGLGAPQDFGKAHMWFNLAASRGEAKAVTERGRVGWAHGTRTGGQGARTGRGLAAATRQGIDHGASQVSGCRAGQPASAESHPGGTETPGCPRL